MDTKSTTLFSLSTLKTWMGVTNLNSKEDERLVVAADAASEEIENQTGRRFVIRTLTETFSGRWQTTLYTKFAPISDGAAVTITVDGSALSTSAFFVEEDTGVIELLNYARFNKGQKNIVVTYPTGYDKKDGQNLPRDVVRAGVDLAKAIYDELARGSISVSSVTMGPSTTVVKAEDFPLSVKRVIQNWKSSRIV